MNKRELLYEQGTDEEIIMLLNFDDIFNKMLAIVKGNTTVKKTVRDIKKLLNLSKEEFDAVYYGKFPRWLHDYTLECWSGYVGTTLDKQLLTIILRLDIDEWDLHIKGLEDQVKCLEFYNNILKNEAL